MPQLATGSAVPDPVDGRGENPRADIPGARAAFVEAPALSDPRMAALLARAERAGVGAGRAALLAEVDAAALCAADRVTHMRLWHGHLNWATAQAHLSVAAVAGASEADGENHPTSTPTGNVAEDSICAEVGAALRLTPYSAKSTIEQARAAVGALAPVTARMLAGQWSSRHLWQAQEATRGHAIALACAAVDAAVEAARTDCSASQFRHRLRRELCRLDSVAVAARIRARRRERDARLDPEGDFKGRLSITGAWETLNWTNRQFRRWAEVERARLRKLAKGHPGARFCCPDALAATTAGATTAGATTAGDADATRDTTSPLASGFLAGEPCPVCGADDRGLPTIAELAADAVTEAAKLLAAKLADPASEDLAPARGRRWRHAVVMVDLPTLLGAADKPGWVPGYGHVPAAIARELAADAPAWRRFLVDSTGTLTDIGRTVYRPGAALREFVTARDLTCTFPHCGRPASEADLDHRENFNGSNTRAGNLQALCRTHHRIKTSADWVPTRMPEEAGGIEAAAGEAGPQEPGYTRWQAPSGHTYDHRPEPPWPQPGRSRERPHLATAVSPFFHPPDHLPRRLIA